MLLKLLNDNKIKTAKQARLLTKIKPKQDLRVAHT